VVEHFRVFSRVGFFVFGVAEQPQRPSMALGQLKKGRLIMYIGGGLITLVIIVVVVVFFVRGF
jgi:hypothetical protein